MRLVVVLGLCALAFATHRTKISNTEWLTEATGNNKWRVGEETFRSQREYRFIYNGQIATGIPQTSEQHVATRLQAVVSLIMKTDTTVLLKLTHIRMGYEHRDIAEPRQMLPFEVFEETPIEPEFEKLLKLPITFKYSNGLISELTFDGEEKPWTANVKRGVLNMLQVNLKQHARTDMSEEQLLLNAPQEPISKHNDFFAVQEKTLEGDCEVFYTVTKQPHEKWTTTQSVLNVTKSINFEKCRNRPDIRYNMRFGEECESCSRKYSQEERNMDSSTVFEYNITGTVEQFLIESVRVKSQYVFAPLNEQSNVITTYVTQTLKLVHAGPIETRIEMPTNAKLSDSQLVYTQDWDEQKERFFMDGDREFLKDTPYTEIRDKVKLMEPLMQRLLTAMSNDHQGIEQEATRQLARIVKVLRMCDRSEIEKIHQAFYEHQTEKYTTEQHEKVKDMLVDALALAGTKTTIEHLIEKIKQRKVHPTKAAIALKALINTRVVSEKQIELVMELCKDPVCERNPFLKQSCFLTVGSMINALCKNNDDRLAMEQTTFHHTTQKVPTKFCPIQLKQKYVREFIGMFEQASTQYEKILYLKTLANAGIDLAVFDLEKIIKNHQEVPMIRTQAIDALRLLRSVMPRKIQKILMPVFKNKYELPEIRMVAVAQIMQTLPERPVLDQITEQLYLEKSQQVHTFVYTLLDTLANSTNPCEKRCAEDIQVSLRRARMLFKTIPKSQYRHYRFYDEDWDLGASLNLGVIFGNDSFIPKEAMVNLGTLVRGEWNKFVAQIGFIQQNTENLIEQLLGHQGLLVEKSFEQLITRGRRAIVDQPSGYLRTLFQKLGVRGRRQRDQQPSAMLYIRYKDQDYGMLPIDYETFPESIKNAISNDRLNLQFIERFFAQGYRFNYQTAGFIHESQRKIATTLGFPLVLSGKIPTVASINGQLKIQMDPTSGNRINGGKIQLHARPSIATTMICKMEVWSPIVNAGLKIVQSMQLNVPLKFEVEMNTERKPMELKWTITMPEQKTRLVTIQSRPVTFVRTWPKQLTTYAEPHEKTVYGEQWDRINTFDKKVGENTIGVLFHVHGQWHRTPVDSLTGTPLAPFAGNNQLQITMEPGYMPPKEYIIRLEADSLDVSDTVERPEFEQFYNTKDEQTFFLDDSSSSSSEQSSNSKTESNSASGELSAEQNKQSYLRYAKSYVPKQTYKHRMVIKVDTTGSTVQRKSQMEIRTQFDTETRFCKLAIDMTRSPIPAGKYRETRPWTLKAKMQSLYPKMPFTLVELKETSDDQRQFTAQLEAEWGSDQQQFVNLKVQGERSMWQKRRQQKYIVEAEQRREYSAVQQYEQLMRVSMLDQYKMHVAYKLSPAFRNYTNKVYRFLKYSNYDNCKVDEIGVENPTNRLQMQVNIDPRTLQYVNVTVETPRENTRFVDVALPFPIRPINIRRSYGSVRSMKDLFFTSIATTVGLPKCIVSQDRVRTFDKVKYNVPLTTCYSVLAKDCSGYDHPAFVVLMKKIDQNREHKKVKIVTQEKQIEMWMEHNDQMKIRVNGKSINPSNEQEIDEYDIHQEGPSTFVVQLPAIGVRVTFDGYGAIIQMSHLYKNAQCGLCGHYNDEKTDIFRTASNELVDDISKFHRSYLQRDDECQIDEQILSDKKRYRYNSQSWEVNSDSSSSSSSSSESHSRSSSTSRQHETSKSKSKSNSRSSSSSSSQETSQMTSSEVDERKPRLATKVIEYNHELCFSTKPIHECPTNTYPVEHQTEAKKVSFGCLPRTDSQAVRLEREVMRQRIVNTDQLKPSFVETVYVPLKCKRV